MAEPRALYRNRRIGFVASATCTLCFGKELPVVRAWFDNGGTRTVKGKQVPDTLDVHEIAAFCEQCFGRLAACWLEAEEDG